MNTANIVVMGKTGAGKSTLVNAVMESEVAPTGSGQPVTLENQVYSRKILIKPTDSCVDDFRFVGHTLNLYDTVGLELDSSVTNSTLSGIKDYIQKAQRNETDSNTSIVWFCVSMNSSRFEPYEVDLIKKLANDFEIPFIVVTTQCFTDERGELEKQIEMELPEVAICRVLANSYKTRAGTIAAYGIQELLTKSIYEHKKLKINVLESKLDDLLHRREDRVVEIVEKANGCIKKHSKSAQRVAYLPGACIPFVHSICVKMLSDINHTIGIHTAKGFESELFANIMLGVVVTPFMAIPIFSSIVASSYVETVGEQYRDCLITVIKKSTDTELSNIELVSDRIKAELSRRKNN